MNETKLILGIDPGSAGGCAWLNLDSSSVFADKMPQGMTEIYDYLRDTLGSQFTSNVVCYLEDVGNGIPNQSSKATSTFARHNGHLEMALYALGIKTIKVTPQKWQKALGFGSSKQKGMGKTEWKNYLKAEAKRLFPNINITLSTADALLIAEYGRRQEK